MYVCMCYGISGPLFNWFESFLTNRAQSVACDGKCSNPSPVTSGVLQGIVLVPLLFLLHVNELPDNLKSSIRFFADGALVYSVISNEGDGNQLQDDLRQLEMWQSKWQTVFNPSQCKKYVFPLRKYPHKGNTFFVELNWNRLNVFPIWVYYWMKSWSGPDTLHPFPGNRVKFWAWLKGTFGIVQKTFRQLPIQP